MKKIVLLLLLVISMIGLSYEKNERYIERCKVTSIGKYKDGTKYMNCTSLETGRNFNFIEEKQYTEFLHRVDGPESFKIGSVHKIWFKGKGYKNLQMLDRTSAE